MDLLHPRVVEYLGELARHGDPVLERMEAEARETRFPIVGPAAGQFCYLVARMLGARRIFELGSGYGYSTLWFAKAVRENGGGEVYHTVWDEGLSTRARRNVEEAGLGDIVRFHVGEAVAALRETPGPFDLIFNDIDKQGYPASLPVIKEKLRVGGAIVIDNMLWHGGIFDDSITSEQKRGVQEYTRRIYADKEFVSSLIPIRDGLVLSLRVA
jgi:predicted O-methyltransferase YrrM